MMRAVHHKFFIALMLVLLVGCGEQQSAPPAAVAGDGLPDTPKGLDYEFYVDAVEPIFMRHRTHSPALWVYQAGHRRPLRQVAPTAVLRNRQARPTSG
ncbi:MAG: hypothetical protein RL120_01510, partial [Gammaproteobacteria bacterium]